MGARLKELPALGDAQVALSLLRHCTSARPRYLQRTLAPTPAVLDIYTRFNRQLRGVVADLLEEELAHSDDVAPHWARQAAVPIKWGGLGLGDPALTALSPHLGCWEQITPLLLTRFPVGDRFAFASAFSPTPASELPFQLSLMDAFTPMPPSSWALSPDFLSWGFTPPSIDTASLIASV